MRRKILIIVSILLALGAIEGVAYWWMHPAPADLGKPVLAYRPEIADHGSEIMDESDPASSPSLLFPISNLTSFTPLPELVSRSIPSLRCSTGTAARIDRDDGIVVHVAFFQWDLAASDNVLEAFKHLPEECMGSIGMTLVEIHPPRAYVVRGQESGDGAQSGVRVQEEAPASSPNLEYPISSLHLLFDHTEFRDPAGRPIHAFKGVWVSGAADLLGEGVRGGGEQWREIRWRSALKRFRPAHARVAQGAVHGIASPARAWEIFEESMLNDLKFE